MLYEINVSRFGKHLFATKERSIMSLTKLRQLADLFENRFPKEDGFEVTVAVVRMFSDEYTVARLQQTDDNDVFHPH